MNLMTPRKSQRTQAEKDALVRVSFDVPKDIRNKFKAKLAIEDKTLRDAFLNFMKEYIKK